MEFDPSKYGATEVFDPSKYGAKEVVQQIQQAQQQSNQPSLDIGSHNRILADILGGAIEGGQNIHNLPYAAVKGLSQLGIVSPQATKYVPQPTNIDVRQLIGAKDNILDKALRGSVSYIPQLMTAGASIPGQAIAGGLTGAAQAPENPLIGGALGAAGGAAGGAISKVPALISYLKPQKYLNEVMETLGGSKDVNEITKSLASDIKNNATQIKKQYQDMLKPVQDQASGYNLYQSDAGIIPNTYKELAKKYEGTYLGGAKSLHENFLETPTFDNAHKLQSQLGTEARKLKGTDVATADAKSKLIDLRSAVKNDIGNFLNKQDTTGNLANQYNAASDFYLNEYVPYKNIKTLSDVMGQKGASSGSLLGAFKNPKLTVEEGRIPDALKVANDLGDAGKQKIIALELAKKKSITPEKAVSAYKDLETTGLSEYSTLTLDQMMKTLENKIKWKNIAKNSVKTTAKVAGIGTGVAALSHLGIPIYQKITGQ